jgi:hypothetical protein
MEFKQAGSTSMLWTQQVFSVRSQCCGNWWRRCILILGLNYVAVIERNLIIRTSFHIRFVLRNGTENAFKGSLNKYQEFLWSHVLKLVGKFSSISWFIINTESKGSVLTKESVRGSMPWVKKDQFLQIMTLGTIYSDMYSQPGDWFNFHLYKNSFAWA